MIDPPGASSVHTWSSNGKVSKRCRFEAVVAFKYLNLLLIPKTPPRTASVFLISFPSLDRCSMNLLVFACLFSHPQNKKLKNIHN